MAMYRYALPAGGQKGVFQVVVYGSGYGVDGCTSRWCNTHGVLCTTCSAHHLCVYTHSSMHQCMYCIMPLVQRPYTGVVQYCSTVPCIHAVHHVAYAPVYHVLYGSAYTAIH